MFDSLVYLSSSHKYIERVKKMEKRLKKRGKLKYIRYLTSKVFSTFFSSIRFVLLFFLNPFALIISSLLDFIYFCLNFSYSILLKHLYSFYVYKVHLLSFIGISKLYVEMEANNEKRVKLVNFNFKFIIYLSLIHYQVN